MPEISRIQKKLPPGDPIGYADEYAEELAVKITVVGSITYIGYAAPGTAQSAAAWRCKKIDETTGTVITWADGDTNFDNVATDLTALTYS